MKKTLTICLSLWAISWAPDPVLAQKHDECELATASIYDGVHGGDGAYTHDARRPIPPAHRPNYSSDKSLHARDLRTKSSAVLYDMMFNSPSASDRMAIAEVARGRTDPEILEMVKQAYEVEPTNDVRGALLEVAAQIDSPESRAFLNEVEKDSEIYPAVANFFYQRSLSEDPAHAHPETRRITRIDDISGNVSRVPMLPPQEHLRNAARIAKAIYRHPDAGTTPNPERLVSKYIEFQDGSLPGYIPAQPVTDPQTGLKAALFVPEHADKNKPAMLAFAGTHSYATALADGNLGFDQSRSRVLEPLYAQAMETLLRGEDFYVVGHSLGGGLAQRFGAELRKRLEKNPSFQEDREQIGNIHAITFNSFGVKDRLISERESANPPPENDLNYRGTNFRLQGDFVSPIGIPTGSPAITLPASPNRSRLRRHEIDGVIDALDRVAIDEQTPASPPPTIPGVIAGTRLVGWIAELNQRQRFRQNVVDITQRLTKAQYLYTAQRGYRDLDQQNRWLEPELRHIRRVVMSGEVSNYRRQAVLKILDEHERAMEDLVREYQDPASRFSLALP